MQSSFAARVSQLISVVRASGDIEYDNTAMPIKHLVPAISWHLKNNAQYPPVAELKQRLRQRRGIEERKEFSRYVLLAIGLGLWNGNRPTGSRCLTVDSNNPIG